MSQGRLARIVATLLKWLCLTTHIGTQRVLKYFAKLEDNTSLKDNTPFKRAHLSPRTHLSTITHAYCIPQFSIIHFKIANL